MIHHMNNTIESNRTKLFPNVIGRKIQNFKSLVRRSLSLISKTDDHVNHR